MQIEGVGGSLQKAGAGGKIAPLPCPMGIRPPTFADPQDVSVRRLGAVVPSSSCPHNEDLGYGHFAFGNG